VAYSLPLGLHARLPHRFSRREPDSARRYGVGDTASKTSVRIAAKGKSGKVGKVGKVGTLPIFVVRGVSRGIFSPAGAARKAAAALQSHGTRQPAPLRRRGRRVKDFGADGRQDVRVKAAASP
jgi:hypothetical protein